MTVHAMTLPGLDGSTSSCTGCDGFPTVVHEDRYPDWDARVRAGDRQRLQAYLTDFARPSDHSRVCLYRYLPGSVHRRFTDPDDLDAALERQKAVLPNPF